MMRVQAIGLNATIDLHDHHLIIHRRGDMFSGGPTELLVPLNSIKSVQFRRPSGWRSGRIIISLEGAAAPKLSDYQRKMDPMSVTFSDYHLAQFEQILEVIREAIAMPSIEQMAMGAQRNRQEQVSQARPQPKPTRAVLERIDPPRQSYNPNTGANYDDTGTSGHQAYHHPGGGRADEPPLNPSVGEWWREVHPLAKIILIAIPIIVLLTMCSGPGEDAAPAPVEPAMEATEAVPADAQDPSYNYIDGMPPIGQLVMDGDSRACSHPATLQTLRDIILPDNMQPDALGVSAGELRRAVRAAKTVVSQVTLDNIRTDIHEMSCSGTLDYGGGNTIPIAFTLRPEADQNGDVMVALADQPSITQDVLEAPLADIRNRRRPPPTAPAAAPGNLQDQAVGISDDDRYAPH